MVVDRIEVVLARLGTTRRALVCSIQVERQASVRVEVTSSFLSTLTSRVRNTLGSERLVVYRAYGRRLFSNEFVTRYDLARAIEINECVTRVRRLGSLAFGLFSRGERSVLLFLLVLERRSGAYAVFSLFQCESALGGGGLV